MGKALQKIKGKVKSALTKVRNAGRTLGKKLRKSKIGQALKNSGRKMRDFFKKKRDHLRDDKKRRVNHRKRSRDERRKKGRILPRPSRHAWRRRLPGSVPSRREN